MLNHNEKPFLLPSFQEALDYLDGFKNYERVGDYPVGHNSMSTERMDLLLEALGSPHKRYPVIHIAGTKGKGSTAYLTSAAFEGLGLRCGLYTSPHVTDLLERMQISGRKINRSYFCKAFSTVKYAIEQMADDQRPTYFEILTAIGFQVFADQAVDIAVFEVGLGGRLDATNVSDMPVAVSCITPVSLDHTRVLGNQLADIALEKAGILRRDTPLILGPQQGVARKSIIRKAQSLNCRIWEVGEDITITDSEFLDPVKNSGVMQRFDIITPRGKYHDICLALGGEHQQSNAACALALVEAFLEAAVDEDILRRSWVRLTLPGRFEGLGTGPYVVLDGAHNPASAWALCESISQYYEHVKAKTLVFSVCRDKDVRSIMKVLFPMFNSVIFTTNNSPRHIPPQELAEMALELYPDIRHDVKDDPCDAVILASKASGDNGLTVVSGSLYLIGDVRDFCLEFFNHVPS